MRSLALCATHIVLLCGGDGDEGATEVWEAALPQAAATASSSSSGMAASAASGVLLAFERSLPSCLGGGGGGGDVVGAVAAPCRTALISGCGEAAFLPWLSPTRIAQHTQPATYAAAQRASGVASAATALLGAASDGAANAKTNSGGGGLLFPLGRVALLSLSPCGKRGLAATVAELRTEREMRAVGTGSAFGGRGSCDSCVGLPSSCFVGQAEGEKKDDDTEAVAATADATQRTNYLYLGSSAALGWDKAEGMAAKTTEVAAAKRAAEAAAVAAEVRRRSGPSRYALPRAATKQCTSSAVAVPSLSMLCEQHLARHVTPANAISAIAVAQTTGFTDSAGGAMHGPLATAAAACLRANADVALLQIARSSAQAAKPNSSSGNGNCAGAVSGALPLPPWLDFPREKPDERMGDGLDGLNDESASDCDEGGRVEVEVSSETRQAAIAKTPTAGAKVGAPADATVEARQEQPCITPSSLALSSGAATWAPQPSPEPQQAKQQQAKQLQTMQQKQQKQQASQRRQIKQQQQQQQAAASWDASADAFRSWESGRVGSAAGGWNPSIDVAAATTADDAGGGGGATLFDAFEAAQQRKRAGKVATVAWMKADEEEGEEEEVNEEEQRGLNAGASSTTAKAQLPTKTKPAETMPTSKGKKKKIKKTLGLHEIMAKQQQQVRETRLTVLVVDAYSTPHDFSPPYAPYQVDGPRRQGGQWGMLGEPLHLRASDAKAAQQKQQSVAAAAAAAFGGEVGN